MALRPLWTPEDVRRRHEAAKVLLNSQVMQILMYCGEKFVAIARDLADFTDQTGNLRSSIGYIIVKDGKIIKGDFKKVKGGDEGIKNGYDHAKKLAQEFKRGFILIGVAGMDYAAAVESKGYEVISTSSLTIKGYLEERLDKIRK